MSGLFVLHSKALGGFYRSDIYAVADSFEGAREMIRRAFRRWLRDPDNAHHFDTVPLGDMTTEEEARANLLAKMEELEQELGSVKLATHGTLVEVST